MGMEEYDIKRLGLAYRRMMAGKETLFDYVRGRLEDICAAALGACPEGCGVTRICYHTDMTVSGDSTLPFTLSVKLVVECDRPFQGLPPAEVPLIERKHHINMNAERLASFLDGLSDEAVSLVRSPALKGRIAGIMGWAS